MGIEKQSAVVCLVIALAVGGVGCGPSDSGAGSSMAEVATQLDAQNAAQHQQDQAKSEAERKAQDAQTAPAEQPRTEAGRGNIGEGGYFTAIAGARRHVLNKVEDLEWTQGVQHFQATEGRLPKDHDEFMNRIIVPLGIDLGFKEEGQEFLYDPTPIEDHPWGTVYVVEAATQPAAQQ